MKLIINNLVTTPTNGPTTSTSKAQMTTDAIGRTAIFAILKNA